MELRNLRISEDLFDSDVAGNASGNVAFQQSLGDRKNLPFSQDLKAVTIVTKQPLVSVTKAEMNDKNVPIYSQLISSYLNKPPDDPTSKD